MVDVEVLLRLVVDINFELRDFIFRLCSNNEIVRRKDLKLFTLSGIIVLDRD